MYHQWRDTKWSTSWKFKCYGGKIWYILKQNGHQPKGCYKIQGLSKFHCEREPDSDRQTSYTLCKEKGIILDNNIN